MTDSSDPFDDQVNAADREVRGRLRHPIAGPASGPERVLVDRLQDPKVDWRRCPHLRGPRPTHWVAGTNLYTCDDCLGVAMRQRMTGSPTDAYHCDVCGRPCGDTVEKLTIAAGPFLIHAGLCQACAGDLPADPEPPPPPSPRSRDW
jgi:hypothetical protein